MDTTEKLILFKKAEGTNCYLVQVTSNDDYWDECPALYVHLTKELKKTIKAAQFLYFTGKQEGLNDLCNIQLFCNAPQWLHYSEVREISDELNSEEVRKLTDEGFIDIDTLNPYNDEEEDYYEVEAISENQDNAIEEISTEYATVTVDDDSFYFSAYVKNTNIKLRGEGLPITMLTNFADDGNE